MSLQKKARTQQKSPPSILLICASILLLCLSAFIATSTFLPEENRRAPMLSLPEKVKIAQKLIIQTVAKFALRTLDWYTLPFDHGTFEYEGIQNKASIYYDDIGTPHIYARTPNDLYRAIGFTHARDRLFQVEFARLAAQGKLSEMFGEKTLPMDRYFRVLGFARRGKLDAQKLDPETRSMIIEYVEGLNAYLQKFKKNFPVEFKILGHTPKPFQVDEILAYARLVAWNLNYGDQKEFIRLDIFREIHGLFQDIDYKITPLNNINMEFDIDYIKYLVSLYTNPMGSNAFAVSGQHTQSGKPILASDPHLQLTNPSVWYQMHLKQDDLHTIGVTMPGSPFIIFGHNEDISWGCVLTLIDVKDHYIETVDWGTNTYLFKNQSIPLKVHDEVIYIKNTNTPFIEHVYETHHGPIVSTLTKNKYLEGKMLETSIQSISFLESSTLPLGLRQLSFAKNVYDAREALIKVNTATLGFVVTDKQNIAYIPTGDLPIKKHGQGIFPSIGWTGQEEWQGFIPENDRPVIVNPPEGFIVTSNNRMVGKDYPYYLGETFLPPTRYARIVSLIRKLIDSNTKINVDNMAAIQQDLVDVVALRYKDLLFRYVEVSDFDSDIEKKAFEMLVGWDGSHDVNSVPASIAQAALLESTRLLLETKISETNVDKLLGVAETYNIEALPHITVQFLDLVDNPSSGWWHDTSPHEIFLAGFESSIEWLTDVMGNDMATWRWGRFHRVKWQHTLGRSSEILDHVFSVGPFESPGTMHTPAKGAFEFTREKGYLDLSSSGVSYRHVIDMGHLDEAIWVHGPGQSGRLTSTHREDQVVKWLDKGYTKMYWHQHEIEEKFNRTKIVLTRIP